VAKDALGLDPSQVYVPYSDLKSLVGRYVDNIWQEQWSQQTDNKLFQIMPNLSNNKFLTGGNRRAETVLNRLLIGHTFFTHAFLLRNEDPPWCHSCDVPYSVKHLLVECTDLIDERNSYLGLKSDVREILIYHLIALILTHLSDLCIIIRLIMVNSCLWYSIPFRDISFTQKETKNE